MPKSTLVLCLFLLLQGVLYAQDRTINGKVVNKLNKEPVVGATIGLKGSSKGSTASPDGTFSLSVPAGNVTLVVSSVGFLTTETAVPASSASVTIELEEDTKKLTEVVVTALGIQRQAKSLTYATQKISGAKVNEIRDANFVNTLSGKVAGLVVTTAGSGPGSSVRVILRGNRSIQGNNNALFVVDGVAVDNSLQSIVTNDFGGQNGSDGAVTINPDDIESINVLKGAASSALYGSRAGNGVILISTKKGKPGELSVETNSGISFDAPLILPKVQNEFAQGNGGEFAARAGQSWGPKMTGQTVTDWRGQSSPLTADPKNIRNFYRTAVNVNNYVGVSAGTDKMQTYFSYTNNYNEGLVPTNYLNRNTVNLRIARQFGDKISTDIKVTYANQNIYNKPRVGEESSVTMNLYKIPRNVHLADIKNYQAVDDDGIATPVYWTSSSIYTNPYWSVYNTHHDETRNRVTGFAMAKYNITSWLSLQGRFSMDLYNDKVVETYANNTLLFAQQGGSMNVGRYDISERNMDVLLTGNNDITSDLKISYNLGASVLDRQADVAVTLADGLRIPNKFDLKFATNLSMDPLLTNFAKTQLQSVYGTVQFSFKEYLYLDLTARNDWSSTLPPPYSYFYPSAGLTAVLSEMFKMPAWITFGKIRAAYTRVGNDAQPYRTIQTYNFAQGGSGGLINRDIIKAIGDLKPELTTSFEAGLDWRFFDNRLGFDVTVYNTHTINQLLSLTAAPASGFTTEYINAGDIQNTGIELTLTATPLQRPKGLTWDMTLNFASNKNKVIRLSPDIKRAFLGGGFGRTATPVVEEGGSYGDLYGFKWLRNENGEFVVNDKGIPVATTEQEFIGNFNPKFTAGWSHTFSFRNFTATILFDSRFGGIMTSGTDANLAFDGTAPYTIPYRNGGWILPAVGPNGAKNAQATDAESFWTTVSQSRYSWGEFFTYDATNVRVREFSIGYSFSKFNIRYIKEIKLSAIGRNLFFLYRGKAKMNIPGIGERKMEFDPDINLGAGNYQGVEYGTMPPVRSIGLNLKLSF